MNAKRCFPPVVDDRSRLLLLGSLPGERSLEKAEYYGHPQNHFWRLIGCAIGADLVLLNYLARLQTLLDHRIGMWDVVGEAQRAGSLDGAIRSAVTNDLVALVTSLPELRAVAFNGGTAARIGRKLLGGTTGPTLIDLPSSSPAYTLPFARKAEAWRRIAEFL